MNDPRQQLEARLDQPRAHHEEVAFRLVMAVNPRGAPASA
ncbi:hypothetical protein SAMCCGM7_pB0197 (plasmid) [Sinorhizobium americanum CCGM7]|nr:hypothetical protein SAMCCGM7_pB0197 [Sinorhizobium americanum CCGM7]